MAEKRKRLTQKERKYRAKAKKELQAAGLIPPDKPRLNRKRFRADVMKEWEENFCLGSISDSLFFSRAVMWMLADVPNMPVTPEQIGLLKTMKIAIELKQMYQRTESGTVRHTIKDEYEHIKNIIDL